MRRYFNQPFLELRINVVNSQISAVVRRISDQPILVGIKVKTNDPLTSGTDVCRNLFRHLNLKTGFCVALSDDLIGGEEDHVIATIVINLFTFTNWSKIQKIFLKTKNSLILKISLSSRSCRHPKEKIRGKKENAKKN